MGGSQTVNGQAMYCLTASGSKVDVDKLKACSEDAANKPFMIGSSVLCHGGRVIIAGGGATCFSMGTFWDTNVYQAQMPTILSGDRKLPKEGGQSTEVVVHECLLENGKMDFNAKNFRYITDDFGTIMTRANNGDRLYLRSLSNDKPAEQPAKLEDDYPGLAAEFSLPEQLSYVKTQIFSSVLRVSGKVNMWLHYDVMANVYAQIVGSKRMILFPPSDVSQLAFAPGASSSSVDVFAALETAKLASTRPHEAMVGPGDVLFLPPLWLHAAAPTTNMSVAVNVFFRDLSSGYASGRDVYGNRDLAAYEKGRQDVAKIAKQFQQLPEEIRKFYLTRLADELLQAAGSN
ncbi:leucine carboxyl methyltransferase [Cordyceps fumosorosea ARSEF 2679]|uniref:Leucine carboxyl methyltransferase n=1 Tax=Cordyceps fumosorosea (strain ARSEF 2679) TaxID=1081104 RepID=A0A167RQK4_CORFA|nr:leucine carboxyl methyltransferase [Cordyceps fumosorosea ARSEF 2679]OAA58834.1 leucine carboxyl methyltransferase [Cordyceps fumosorosea ARSEF 2679]